MNTPIAFPKKEGGKKKLIQTNLTTWLSKNLCKHGRIAGATKFPHGNTELHSNVIAEGNTMAKISQTGYKPIR